MPCSILLKHQAQTTAAAAAAPTAAGPDAEEENGQHAESRPAPSWWRAGGKRSAISEWQQWSYWSFHPYVCWYAASNPTNSQPREHARASSATRRSDWWDGHPRSTTRGYGSPSTPYAPVSARRDDYFSSTADGVTAPPAAGSQYSAAPASYWFTSIQPQTPWTVFSPSVTRETRIGSSHPTPAAAQPGTGVNVCPRPAARAPSSRSRDGPKDSTASRDPKSAGSGADSWFGTGRHDAPTSSPPKQPDTDGNAPHWGPRHGLSGSGSCWQDYSGTAATWNLSWNAAKWRTVPAAPSSSTATSANKPAVGSQRGGHEPTNKDRHDGFYGPTTAGCHWSTAATTDESATGPSRKPRLNAGVGCFRGSSRPSWVNARRRIRKPSPGGSPRASAYTPFSNVTPTAAASPQHPAFQPNSNGCVHTPENGQVPGGSGRSWRATSRGPWRC